MHAYCVNCVQFATIVDGPGGKLDVDYDFSQNEAQPGDREHVFGFKGELRSYHLIRYMETLRALDSKDNATGTSHFHDSQFIIMERANGHSL